MSSFGGCRTAAARMADIFRTVKNGELPTCKSLAERYEVSAKTIQRDIAHMRDQMGLEVVYNQKLHGFELAEDAEFPLIDLEVEDLAALFLARHALASAQGTKLAKVLAPAIEKLSKQLDGKVSINWLEMDEAFAVKENGVIEADLTLFGKIAEAVLKQQEITFKYRKSGATTSDERRLHPYHVGEISGGWYVIGYDVDRDGLRTFALQRIVGLKVTNTTFERPNDFSIGSYLGGSVGVWNTQGSGEPVSVVLELTDWVARMAQERLWHESQQVKVLDDYGQKVELRLQLTSLEEFTSIILGWGRYAKVIEPLELKQRIKDELDMMSSFYDDC